MVVLCLFEKVTYSNERSTKFESPTAPFNNMQTLKFKAQPTNAFFATVNQMLAGTSQLSTAAERTVIKSIVHSSDNEQGSAVVVSWEDPPNT